MAMKHGLGLNKILGTIHIYPTLAEASKYAAGEWRRAHKPKAVVICRAFSCVEARMIDAALQPSATVFQSPAKILAQWE